MKSDAGFEKISDLFAAKTAKKAPAHEWQDLALRIIAELGVPNFKRNSVFKVCKEHPKEYIERSLNDTKELCKTGERWKYFFKIMGAQKYAEDDRMIQKKT